MKLLAYSIPFINVYILKHFRLIIHLCYNGNSLQTSNLPFNTYVSFSVGAFLEIPVNMFCILSLDRFGRKWPDVICLYVGGILGIISGCLSKSKNRNFSFYIESIWYCFDRVFTVYLLNRGYSLVTFYLSVI